MKCKLKATSTKTMGSNKLVWLLFCVFLIAHDFQVCSGNWLKPDKLHYEEIHDFPSNVSETKHGLRKKRFVGSLIIAAFEITDAALTIANAVKDGCVYYPRICTNRETIKEYEKKEETIRNNINSEHGMILQEIRNLTTVFLNNDAIYNAINETVNISFEVFAAMYQWLSLRPSELQVKANFTLTQVEQLLSKVPTDIDKMFESGRQNALKTMGIAIGVKVIFVIIYKCVLRFLRSVNFASAFKKTGMSLALNEAGDLVRITSFNEKLGKFSYKPASFKELYTFYKNEYQLDSNFRVDHLATGGVLKSDVITKIIGKLKIRTSFQGKFKAFFTALSKGIQTSMTSFYKSKSFWIGSGFSLIGIGANQAIQVVQYNKLDNEMEKLKNDHIDLYNQLTVAHNNLTGMKQDIQYDWNEAICIFTNLTEFIEEMQNASKILADLSGLKQEIPGIDKVLSIDMQNVKRENIVTSQTTLLNFFNNQVKSLKDIRSSFYTKIYIFEVVRDALAKNRETEVIVELVNNKLFNELTQNVTIDKKEILCEISKDVENEFYDYYDLKVFRPDCSALVSIEAEETKRNKFMNKLKLVKVALNNCDIYEICVPFDLIANKSGLTVNQVKLTMKQLNRTTYNDIPL